ncbi:MAG: putative two-component system response regulator [Bacteroidetes bacterium]|nr:putative two-component system response regulator [Bacteroidota bacterium]
MNCKNITDLTSRERQILQLIGEGWNSSEIAERINLSTNTVCTHRKNILRKTGARNIVSVLILAVQERLIRVDVLAA